MDIVIRNILKAQNDKLLDAISAEFGLDASAIKQKYLTPSFYCIDIDRTQSGVITCTDKYLKADKNVKTNNSNASDLSDAKSISDIKRTAARKTARKKKIDNASN